MKKQTSAPSKVYLNPLPFLHRVGLYPCILPAQRIDSTPSCVWFSSSLIENRALTWTLWALLDSSQKDTGKELVSEENGKTPLCPTSSFLFFFSSVKEKTLTKAGTIPVVSVALASGRVSAGSPEKIICRVVNWKMSPLLNSLHQRNGVMGTYPGKRKELLSEFKFFLKNANSLQLSHHASKLFIYYFSPHQHQRVYINLWEFIANSLHGITTADTTVFIVIKFFPDCSPNTPFFPVQMLKLFIFKIIRVSVVIFSNLFDFFSSVCYGLLYLPL